VVGLVDRGWPAVSEDLCVLDLSGGRPVVWPGPPWVRRSHGLAGPAGAQPRFSSPDKIAWDIESALVNHPVPLGEIVFLEEPGDASVERQSLVSSEVVRRLAAHALWLGRSDEKGPRLFGPIVDVAGSAPATALRMPRRESWLDELPDVLAAAP
jgi:hypothetical protein